MKPNQPLKQTQVNFVFCLNLSAQSKIKNEEKKTREIVEIKGNFDFLSINLDKNESKSLFNANKNEK